jgi:hypothetical protein
LYFWPAVVQCSVRRLGASRAGRFMIIRFIVQTSCAAVLAHFSVLPASDQTIPEFAKSGAQLDRGGTRRLLQPGPRFKDDPFSLAARGAAPRDVAAVQRGGTPFCVSRAHRQSGKFA